MGQISDIRNPWRDLLLSTPASFRGICFYVESSSRASGRRTVVHEYPKRNDPYAEDMGRTAVRFQFSGYLIYRVHPAPGFNPYVQQRVQLIEALEKDDIGELRHPVHGNWKVICERYSMTESRERGGYTQFDMLFVQHGSPGNSVVAPDTAALVQSRSSTAEQTSLAALDATVAATSVLVPFGIFSPNDAERAVINSGIKIVANVAKI